MTGPLCKASADQEQAQIVYQKGDPAFHMYLILRGTFAFVATPVRDHHKRKSQRLSRGDGIFSPYQLFSFHTYFGDLEFSLFAILLGTAPGLKRGWPEEFTNNEWKDKRAPYTKQDGELQSEITLHRPGTVRCELAGEVLRLPKGDYTNLCRDFPQYATVWRNYSLRREARRQRLRQQHSASLTYDHWAATQIQRFLRNAKSGGGCGVGRLNMPPPLVIRKLSKLSAGNATRSHSADLNELMLSPRGYRNSNSAGSQWGSSAVMMELAALRAEMSQAKAREQQMQRRHEELMGGMRMLQGMLQRVGDPSGVTRPSDVAISLQLSPACSATSCSTAPPAEESWLSASIPFVPRMAASDVAVPMKLASMTFVLGLGCGTTIGWQAACFLYRSDAEREAVRAKVGMYLGLFGGASLLVLVSLGREIMFKR
eukprot:s4800_g2.t3